MHFNYTVYCMKADAIVERYDSFPDAARVSDLRRRWRKCRHGSCVKQSTISTKACNRDLCVKASSICSIKVRTYVIMNGCRLGR